MSFDKNLFPKSVSKNSYSFDVRFCDDLCEDILQFLPLKDKLRLECVSKQFQRTVFVKQYSLSLPRESNLKLKSNYLKSIETVLKKCPNVQRIDSYQGSYEIRKNIRQMITKYCNHLKEFNGYFIGLNEPEFKEFHKKFGIKLEHGHDFSLKEFNLFPNLQSLFLYSHVDLEQILQLNLMQVKRLQFSVYEEKEYLISEVLQKFNEIRHLRLDLIYFNEESVLKALKESPILQNLINFKFWTKLTQRFDFVINCLKEFAKKFPNLKRIHLFIDIKIENITDFEELMSSLKAFPHLKRLNIHLGFESYFTFNKIFSFEGFPQQLTHLSLNIKFKNTFDLVTHLKGLDIHLPNLQSLRLPSPITTNEKGVRKIADILSRLSSLQTIYLWFYPSIDCQPIREKIIEKCLKIRTIEI